MGYGGGAAWDELGRSLTGIGQAVGDRRRLDEEEARRLEQEKYTRGRETAQDARQAKLDARDVERYEGRQEMERIGLGGGSGPIPMIPKSTAPRDLFSGPDRGVQRPEGFMDLPKFSAQGPGPEMMPDPTMQAVSGGYVKRPTPEKPWSPDTDVALLREGERRDRGWVPEPTTPATPRDYTLPSYADALEMIQAEYQDPDPKVPIGTFKGVSGKEMHEMAQALARGEEIQWPEKPKPAPGPAQPTAGPSIASQVGAGLRAGMSQVPGLRNLMPGPEEEPSGTYGVVQDTLPAEPGPRMTSHTSPSPLPIDDALQGFTGGTGEAWQSDPRAMAMIRRINADTTISAEDKAEKIAGVKAEAERLATGGS